MNEKDVTYLQDYVYNTTARHPGLVAFFMNHIKDHFFPQLKYDETLTFERIFLYLKSYVFMRAVNEVSVSLNFILHWKNDCIIVLINPVIAGLSWVFTYAIFDGRGTKTL